MKNKNAAKKPASFSRFKNETHARDDALREKKMEDRLNNLYALSYKYPDSPEIEQEIEELERELDQ